MRRTTVFCVCMGLSLTGCNRPGPEPTSMPAAPTVVSSQPKPLEDVFAIAPASRPATPDGKESPLTCRFFEDKPDNPGVAATHVVYVIDSSGSVLSAFDEILAELKNSVSRLQAGQEFLVLFFSKGTFRAAMPGGLVPASEANKAAFEVALREIRAAGYGSLAIAAVIPAFEAFKAVPDKPGQRKVLFILSDGDFDSEGCLYNRIGRQHVVLEWLRKNNADKAVHVYPIILGEKPSNETEAAMKTIASENGGEYRFVARKY